MEFQKTDETLFDRQFAVNFKAPFFLTQSFAKTFGKGAVVNMLDTDVTATQGSHFAYLLSKKTLAEFTCQHNSPGSAAACRVTEKSVEV